MHGWCWCGNLRLCENRRAGQPQRASSQCLAARTSRNSDCHPRWTWCGSRLVSALSNPPDNLTARPSHPTTFQKTQIFNHLLSCSKKLTSLRVTGNKINARFRAVKSNPQFWNRRCEVKNVNVFFKMFVFFLIVKRCDLFGANWSSKAVNLISADSAFWCSIFVPALFRSLEDHQLFSWSEHCDARAQSTGLTALDRYLADAPVAVS